MIDATAADVTKTDVLAVSPPTVAEIVTGLPLLFATPVTTPVVGSTVARVGSEDDHAAFVMDCVEPSLKVPVRVSGICPPTGMD